MVKVDALSFRVDAEVKAGLERAAAVDDRSVSSLAVRILRAWRTEHGHMRGAPPASKVAARKKAAPSKP
jgi:hypothetical protein